jgi:transposase
MGKIKSTYSPEEKVKVVLEGLSYPDGIAKYCRSKGIRDTLFYKWKSQLEKNAKLVFGPPKKESAGEVRLRNELSRKDTIISELVAENLELKKKHGI